MSVLCFRMISIALEYKDKQSGKQVQNQNIKKKEVVVEIRTRSLFGPVDSAMYRYLSCGDHRHDEPSIF